MGSSLVETSNVQGVAVLVTLVLILPLLVKYFKERRSLQYNLTDLIGLVLSFAWNLACLNTLLPKAGWDPSWVPVSAMMLFLLLPAGFYLGQQNKNLLRPRALLWRTVVSWAAFALPGALLPALIFGVSLVQEDSVPRNDLPAALSWFGLMVPLLIHFWFQSIAEVRKDDTPP